MCQQVRCEKPSLPSRPSQDSTEATLNGVDSIDFTCYPQHLKPTLIEGHVEA